MSNSKNENVLVAPDGSAYLIGFTPEGAPTWGPFEDAMILPCGRLAPVEEVMDAREAYYSNQGE